MPVIPAFRAYAPKPDLGQSFLGGANIATDARVARERIAADAAQAAARISLGRAQLAQAAVENQMEAQARQDLAVRNQLKQQQEIEIEKAYRDTQFGFEERRWKNEEINTSLRLKEAAQGFDQRANYERVLPSFIEKFGATEGPQRAWAQTGAGQLGFSGAVNAGEGRANPDRAFQYKVLNDDEARILKGKDKYNPQYSADEMKQLEDIKVRRATLLSPPTATSAPAAQQQWQVNPESLPYGAPKNPSIYMGDQPAPQFPLMFPSSVAAPAQPAASAIPDNFIAYLKAHPNTAASFDKKFGAGSAKAILGK